jgi:hypothetical protein
MFRDHSSWDAAIADVAGRQYGRIATWQLVELGLDHSTLTVRVRRGWLTLVARGVYAVGLPQCSPQAAWSTALLRVGPDAALNLAAAGAHWRIRRSDAALIDIATPRRKRPIEGIRLHRIALPADELTTFEGLRVTTVSRTIFDLASVLTDARLEWAIAEADKAERDFTPSLQTLLERYAGRRGTARLRRVVARIATHGPRMLRSEVEADFLDLVLDLDPPAETNAWVQAGERSYECDALWRHAWLIVELDSCQHHSDWAAQERDREKDRALVRHGWTVIRVTARMLAFGRAQLRTDLEALIYTPAPRRRSSVGRALHS